MAATLAVNAVFHFEREQIEKRKQNRISSSCNIVLLILFSVFFCSSSCSLLFLSSLASSTFDHHYYYYQWKLQPSLFLSSHRRICDSTNTHQMAAVSRAIQTENRFLVQNFCMPMCQRKEFTQRENRQHIWFMASFQYKITSSKIEHDGENARRHPNPESKQKPRRWLIFYDYIVSEHRSEMDRKNTSTTRNYIFQWIECIIIMRRVCVCVCVFMVKPHTDWSGFRIISFRCFRFSLNWLSAMVSHTIIRS